ncbi:hypothetical protein MKX03_036904 [Papaver bracteatum]|nr:hypothetical protein MKX03_036904 [Papaver bracteatum]
MRNDGAPGKLFVSFEIKALIATLLTLTLVVAIWNVQPYNANLLTSANNTIKSTTSPATKLSNSKSTDPNKRIFTSYALSSKPIQVYGKPWYKCEWISNNSSKPSMRAKATKMLPDWGYGRVYTTVVVNCTFPVNPNEDNSGGKLNIYAYYGPSTKKIAASRIREWMAYHAWFWTEFIFCLRFKMVKSVEFDSYYYNQFVIVNDCLLEFSNVTQFTIEQYPMSSKFCLNDSTQSYTRSGVLAVSTKNNWFLLEEKPFVYDDYMKNLSNTIKQFEERQLEP